MKGTLAPTHQGHDVTLISWPSSGAVTVGSGFAWGPALPRIPRAEGLDKARRPEDEGLAHRGIHRFMVLASVRHCF